MMRKKKTIHRQGENTSLKQGGIETEGNPTEKQALAARSKKRRGRKGEPPAGLTRARNAACTNFLTESRTLFV